MPKIAIPEQELPDWADPSRKSVFEPLYKRAIRKAAEFIPEPDPSDLVNPMIAPGPAGMATTVASRLVDTLAKRLAPRKAAKELSLWLRGASTKADNPSIYKPLSEAEASTKAMGMSRIGGAIPRPTQIQVATSNLTGPSRILARDPTLKKLYNVQSKYRFHTGMTKDPHPVNTSTITDTNKASAPFQQNAATRDKKYYARDYLGKANVDVKNLKGVHNSLKNTSIKPMTNQEMTALLESPRKAFKMGMISEEEMTKRLAEGQAKIDAYLNTLKQVDRSNYEHNIRKKISRLEGGR